MNEPLFQEDGSIVVEFRYDFYYDGFSQYDKTVLFTGSLKIDKQGNVEESNLYMIHKGVDAHGPPSKRKFEYRPDLFE